MSVARAILTTVGANKNAISPRNYCIGIDVGTFSCGMSAIEVDEQGVPLRILSAVSQIHDSGVLEHKTATSRLAAAGVARRMRRLRRKRVRRLADLERQFDEWGWARPAPSTDPYSSWRARARLSTERVIDPIEQQRLLVAALRHMARHRGWRNPYSRVESLHAEAEPSALFNDFRQRVEQRVGREMRPGATVAELSIMALDYAPGTPLRMGKTANSRAQKAFSFLGGKLMQSDNANELHAYARMQALPDEVSGTLVEVVFAADSPRGSHVSRIGKDPLDGAPRAAKATDTFQRFRIVSVLANVRVKARGVSRPLSLEERNRAFDYLVSFRPSEQPTWTGVASLLGLRRGELAGVASLDDDLAERLPLRPPIHVTRQRFLQVPAGLKALREWWQSTDSEEKDSLVELLVDGQRDETSRGGVSAWELLHSLSDDELSALDALDLPAGRAAYSIASLRAMTKHMLSSKDDLHLTRKAVFGVDDSWTPPAEPINAPIGHPAVDRVTRIVARWLLAAEAEWGAPARITIEHVREAFLSEDAVRRRDREMRSRFEANEKARLNLRFGSTKDGRISNADIRRLTCITRQNGQCAYCGCVITFHTSEMDHIVPRKGIGSTNTRNNLVAVCIPCNRSKGNMAFAEWASGSPRPGVSVDEAVGRLNHWIRDQGTSSRSWSIFRQEVRERLLRTDSDPEIDSRSMESVAWMANELRERIAAHFAGHRVKVCVYQGALTAGARQAAGIADKIPFIGGGGKTRLDRRHHAVDAAVVALLDESVARTLTERNNLRVAYAFSPRETPVWREYTGSTPAAQQRFSAWRARMGALAELLSRAFAEERVVVTENFRLRLGNGKVHDDTIVPFTRRRVGDTMTRDEIDAASSNALWTALVQSVDYDPVNGLPENNERVLRIHGTRLMADDEIRFFDKRRAALAVRGGWAQLGDSVHHTRIYRREEHGKVKYGMLRIFVADLARHRSEDLFSVAPERSWISIRAADPAIGRSDLTQWEYLGWLVKGDELRIDPTGLNSGIIGDFLSVFTEQIDRWVVTGFETPTLINLRPRLLASEGVDRFVDGKRLSSAQERALKSILERSWRPSVNSLFASHVRSVVRRDALGRSRRHSAAGLPVSWNVD